MLYLTREQREAMLRLYERGPTYLNKKTIPFSITTDPPKGLPFMDAKGNFAIAPPKPLTYRQFRDMAQHGPGCVMINWCGMWIGIEEDGYTHS